MIRALLFVLVLKGTIHSSHAVAREKDDLRIWFTRPAQLWEEGLPVGNGRLGAMIFGGVQTERLQLNEETVWTGQEMDYHNPESLEALEKVRQLLFEGKYAEAEILAQKGIMGQEGRLVRDTYQTLGDLWLYFDPLRNVSEYRRELDIENAVAAVSYLGDGVRYRREIFSSAVDQVLVIRLESDREGALDFSVLLGRPGDRAAVQAEGSLITMSEHVGNGTGVFMVSRLKVLPEGGSMRSSGDSVIIEHADAVTLLFSAATDYRGGDPFLITKQQLDAASLKSYEELYRHHVADYQHYFSRVDLDLGVTDAVYFPTDSRIEAMKNGNIDPSLVRLYYQFGHGDQDDPEI